MEERITSEEMISRLRLERGKRKVPWQLIILVVMFLLVASGGLVIGSKWGFKAHFDAEQTQIEIEREQIKKERDSLEAILKIKEDIELASIARFDSIVRLRDSEFEAAMNNIQWNITNLKQQRDETLNAIYATDSLYLRILARTDQ